MAKHDSYLTQNALKNKKNNNELKRMHLKNKCLILFLPKYIKCKHFAPLFAVMLKHL